MSFAENLQTGKAAESAIAHWLIARGHSILPVYEKIIDEGKGPQLFTGGEGLIAPDMLTFAKGKIVWIEAKHKTGFTWYRKKEVFETGIDLKHYADYLKVSEKTQLPVWLLFLHKGGQAKDSDPSPSGLFGNNIKILEHNESHRTSLWGKSGMVYWTRVCDGGPLIEIASYNDVAPSR